MASPATQLASALAETFRNEEDKVRAQKLFELSAYRSNVDTQEYREVAQLIAELALAGKGQSESQRDLESVGSKCKEVRQSLNQLKSPAGTQSEGQNFLGKSSDKRHNAKRDRGQV